MTQYRNFIGGRFVDKAGLAEIEVRNPANGQIFTTVPAADDADVIAAVEAAKSAQKLWRKLAAIQRGNALRKLADAVERHAPTIGEALALESGKSLADAIAEAIYGVELMRYHAEWARRIEGEIIESDTPDETLLLKREPIGVVACLIPFNFPIYTLVRKIARPPSSPAMPSLSVRVTQPRPPPSRLHKRCWKRVCRTGSSTS